MRMNLPVFLGLLPVSVEMYHLVCLLAKEGGTSASAVRKRGPLTFQKCDSIVPKDSSNNNNKKKKTIVKCGTDSICRPHPNLACGLILQLWTTSYVTSAVKVHSRYIGYNREKGLVIVPSQSLYSMINVINYQNIQISKNRFVYIGL